MKLINLTPKHLFRTSKKSRSVSRSESDPQSFSSGTSSSSDSTMIQIKGGGGATPKSVLRSCSQEISGDWSDLSAANTHLEHLQAFKLIDRDGDGKVTIHELEGLLSRIGGEPPSKEEMLLMLTEIDQDGDGCISLEEFEAISSSLVPAALSDLREAFNVFDADRDGKISAEELLGVFSAIGDDRCTLEDCRRMIRSVDTNGDGFVCFEDFSRMMEGRIK
ncbi:PREDICTED: probable calcium-binding protein CML36 [Nelumbo nucifera]|uniref:Probable calcium-binding protein CML36 n=1 Tax=Nelumbo nucifera TaxID=4432 RepID=A0A1U8BL13_NELNU|nr:PREDICTED: probable calcium-binding protein CML36 [Nelumbo nucifera]